MPLSLDPTLAPAPVPRPHPHLDLQAMPPAVGGYPLRDSVAPTRPELLSDLDQNSGGPNAGEDMSTPSRPNRHISTWSWRATPYDYGKAIPQWGGQPSCGLTYNGTAPALPWSIVGYCIAWSPSCLSSYSSIPNLSRIWGGIPTFLRQPFWLTSS